MSEVVSNEPVVEVAPELESEGQAAAAGEIESLSEQEIEMLPVDEYGDKYVAVQVNGEEVRVPLKEALSGYQRQADYTRKTRNSASNGDKYSLVAHCKKPCKTTQRVLWNC